MVRRFPIDPAWLPLAAGLLGAVLAGCTGQLEDAGGPSGGDGQSAPGGTPMGGSTSGPPASGGAMSVLPGGDARPTPASCAAMPASVKPRVWLLDSRQYAATVATVFGGRAGSSPTPPAPPKNVAFPFGDFAVVGRYSTALLGHQMTADRMEDAYRAADTISQQLLAHPSVAPCATGAGALPDCLAPIVQAKGELLFRRPLGADEVTRYVAAASEVATTAGRAEAVRLALRALLMAPQFLFRAEIGRPQGDAVRLDPYEVASAISYALTDGPPDEALWQDAKSGALGDAAAIGKHVDRLLASLDRAAPIARLISEWFQYDDTTQIMRDAKLIHPIDVVSEADLWVQTVLQRSGHKDLIGQLLGARSGFATQNTAANYGVTTKSAKPVELPWTGERMGLLGHPAWLSSWAKPDQTDPVHRGLFVSERLLCQDIPNAPIAMFPELPTDPKLTLREKIATVMQPSCGVCHVRLNGIGYGLEGFDEVGRGRDTEAGRPVDRNAALIGSGDQDGPFVGLDGLVTKLVASDTVVSCVGRQSLEFFTGRPPGPGDACAIEDARRAYRASGGDYAAMVKALFTSTAFLNRARP